MENLLLYGYGYNWGLIIGFIIGLGIEIWLACWAGRIAKRKGYSYGAFWALTFFCGLIGIIVAACLGDKTTPTTTVHHTTVVTTANSDGWLCTDCLTYNSGTEYCSKCGKPKLGTSIKRPTSWKCEYCGRLNPINDYQCDGCGSRREK